MLEMKIAIEAADLAAAINNLAQALDGGNLCPVCPHAPEKKIEAVGAALAAEPVNPTPATGAPLNVVPAPTVPQTAPSAPVATPAPAAAPVANPVPVQQPAAPVIPQPVPTNAPQYTLEMLATAGSSLIDAGKLDQLMALLGKHGVDSLTNLKPESYGAVATELRAMGARI